jgi:hypothetical protein
MQQGAFLSLTLYFFLYPVFQNWLFFSKLKCLVVGLCLVMGMYILVGFISKIIPSSDQYVTFKLKLDEEKSKHANLVHHNRLCPTLCTIC